MLHRRPLLVLLAVSVAALLIAACSSGSESGDSGGESGDASGSGGALVLYSGRIEELVQPIIDQFSDETGVDVDVRYGDSAELALLIDQEGDRSPADVFYSQAPGAMGFLDAKGRLQELPASTLDRVPAQFRAADGDWVGVTGRVRTLVYNPDVISEAELPQSYEDLTSSEFKDQVGIAPPNGSFQDFVSELRVEQGDDAALEWLEGLKANGARTYANNNAIRDAVGRGEITIGFVNHYYNEKAKAEDPDTVTENYFFPKGDLGALVLVTAAGILDSAEHVSAAEQLLAYLVSDEAQVYFADETFEYPLVPGIPTATVLPPLTEIATPPNDFAELGVDLESTRAMIREAGFTG